MNTSSSGLSDGLKVLVFVINYACPCIIFNLIALII
jgi:hypothetical protein